MNIHELHNLPKEEINLILRTPALVSVLIAGADHRIEHKEVEHAIKAVHFRSLLEGDFLKSYYHLIDDQFEHETYHIIQKFEGKPLERETYIVDNLTRLNDILPKIEKRYANELLDNWRSLAKSVARSAGGFLGFEMISLAESRWVGLKMITFKS